MGVSAVGEFGAGRWYHLVIGASFVARFDKTVSQLIALTETAGKPGRGRQPQRQRLANAGRRYRFLSTGETAGGQN